MRIAVLDGDAISTREELHAALARELALPDWYGGNLDALYDTLTEYGELDVQFVNTEAAAPYFQKVLRVFTDAAKHNEHLHFTVE